MTFETLQVEDHGVARVITINRPDKLNALNEQVIDELLVAIERAGADTQVRGVIMTGAGSKAFVAGADIQAMSEMTVEQATVLAGKGHAVGDLLESLPKPTVAAVNGFALGGGCELALACDFIYASERAKFGQPEVKLGVIPGFGGTQRLLRRVGQARALELCMTGEMIDATTAASLGLVNKILAPEELLNATVAVIETMAKQGPYAVAKAKDVIHRGASMSLQDANLLEQQTFAALFDTPEQREGMAAFLERRSPKFFPPTPESSPE